MGFSVSKWILVELLSVVEGVVVPGCIDIFHLRLVGFLFSFLVQIELIHVNRMHVIFQFADFSAGIELIVFLHISLDQLVQFFITLHLGERYLFR